MFCAANSDAAFFVWFSGLIHRLGLLGPYFGRRERFDGVGVFHLGGTYLGFVLGPLWMALSVLALDPRVFSY